jgi:endonuclease III
MMSALQEANSPDFFPHVEEVTEALVRRFGRPTLGNKQNPFSELLYILLSSKTPPDRYQEVYRALRRVYKRAESLADARPEDVAKVISHGGLQNRKGRAIVSIARRLRQEFGRVTLAPVLKMTNEEAEAFLTSLPEVSKKTARCVLMYALERCVFPVDAHCFRIAQRLRWMPEDSYLTDRRADELQDGIPAHLRRDLHVGMVLLGRYYCFPRSPRCRECPLEEFCPMKDTVSDSRQQT